MNDKYSPPLFVKDDTTILTNLKKGEANARYAILAVRDPRCRRLYGRCA